MGDVFKEQIIKRKPSVRDIALRALIVVVTVIIVIVALIMLASIGVLIAFAIGFGAYYLMSFFNVEYEYIFTNGDLDIDVIYSKSRRKRLFSGNVKSFDIMCHLEDKMRIGEFSGAQAMLDYSSGTPSENTYAFLALHNGKRTKIIIEPNEKMLKAFSGVMSRQKLFVK
ncbi:MAG: DUF6106 family protein [Defluviitaleaceae bacterium]|nr:DUF6106 family protein [Defluviitaleaceae bacterium]